MKSHKSDYLVFVSPHCSSPACCCEVVTTWPQASLSVEYVSLNQSNLFAPSISESLFVDSFENSWLCQGPLWDGHNLTPTEGHWGWAWAGDSLWIIIPCFNVPFQTLCFTTWKINRKPYHRQIHALLLYGHDPQRDFIAFVKLCDKKLHPSPWTQAKSSTTCDDTHTASQLGQCNTCWRSKYKNFFRKSDEGQLKQ